MESSGQFHVEPEGIIRIRKLWDILWFIRIYPIF